MNARERLAKVDAECPDGHYVAIHTRRSLEDFQPGDIVLAYRPDNGHRGRLRVRASVAVARYEPNPVT